MLRGNPPSPNIPFFSLSFYLFSFTFQKKNLKIWGGGFELPEPPPLKYALDCWQKYNVYNQCNFILLYSYSVHDNVHGNVQIQHAVLFERLS